MRYNESGTEAFPSGQTGVDAIQGDVERMAGEPAAAPGWNSIQWTGKQRLRRFPCRAALAMDWQGRARGPLPLGSLVERQKVDR